MPSEHLETVLSDGAFLFRSLSYFQDYEDQQVRGDRHDGTLIYTGDDGLQINNLTTEESFRVQGSFKSKVEAEKIFVFSLSQRLSKDLAMEFKSDICIEFTDVSDVISKLRNAVSRTRRIKPDKLLHGEVTYYGENEAPGILWASPDEIIMRKLNRFSRQEEYRFAFSHDNALSLDRTSQEIEIIKQDKVQRGKPYPDELLKIGSLKGRCRIHEFT